MKIYELNNGICTGASKVVTPLDGCPPGWVRTEEQPPVLQGTEVAQWAGVWVVLPTMPTEPIDTQKAAFILKIDADADAIYSKALGNRETEYAQAESDAKAYKAAGYTGTVPSYVQAWATATGKSATWATDDILATSTAWRTAMAAIRFNRLGRKEDARKAVDVVALEVVKAQWVGFVTAITAQLGV